MASIRDTQFAWYKPHGVKHFGDSCWQHFWVFPAVTPRLESRLEELLEDLRDRAGSGGPGQGFERKPVVRRTATRVLVTQRCGIDI